MYHHLITPPSSIYGIRILAGFSVRGVLFHTKEKSQQLQKKWFFLDLVTTKTWSSCKGLSFLGSLVGCIFQSVLWQNVTFIPLCKIWTTLIPCLKTIFLKTFSSLVSFLFHFVYLQPGLIRLFLKKTFSWQELLLLCHFRCRFITTKVPFLEKFCCVLGKYARLHFFISWECPRCQKKLSRLWIRCLWPLAPDIGLLWQCQYELPAGLHIPKAKVIFPRCASSKYRIWNTSYLFWLI